MAVAVANGIPRARRPTAAADLATSPLACPRHLVRVFLGASSDVARGGSRAARGASAGTARAAATAVADRGRPGGAAGWRDPTPLSSS
ncbi:Os09g0362400 [Oryza sativa Japonica Group]|uniref:Os09g0362400 protein n=1 Tax=Oryza sativa subsp. japonica TaxID=39947 RepID=A0A0P0XL93_ORYSJ|nr:Os09g0362400 [Oryza sativa Japonica Group]